jgi:predicted nucleic-acid-binding protein
MRVAVDTNVLVRLIVEDDSGQTAAVERLARAHHIVVPPAALLETEWVLRRVLGLDRARILTGFEALLGLRGATFLERQAVDAAMRAFADGCDFADALHAMLATDADVFATFDRDFARRARYLEYFPPVALVPVRGDFSGAPGLSS